MRTLVIASAIAVLGATAALAQTPVTTGDDWMSVSAVTAKLEAQGYTVREIERDDGRYEVEMTGSDGIRYEAKVDRATGEITNRERDDD